MEHQAPLVLNVAIALAIAVAGGFAASWLRQSPILGYLAAAAFTLVLKALATFLGIVPFHIAARTAASRLSA